MMYTIRTLRLGCLAIVLCAAVSCARLRTSSAIGVGIEAPQLEAMGWINGPPPDASTLSGKVVVVEVWAHWCPPCRQAAPELVQTYRKFKDRDVQFVGLVSGGDDELPQTQAFIDRYKIPWPNGYGAEATIQSLGVNYIPATFVIGTDGRISWNNEMAGDLDREIEKALGKAKK